jgi:hypothetical protein
LLEAVGLGVNGRLALFRYRGVGGSRLSGDGCNGDMHRHGWRDTRDGGSSLDRGGHGFSNGGWSRRPGRRHLVFYQKNDSHAGQSGHEDQDDDFVPHILSNHFTKQKTDPKQPHTILDRSENCQTCD